MKRIIAMLSLAVVFGAMALQAQPGNIHKNPKYGPDSASRMECANNLSTMSEFMKINLYNYAIPAWNAVFNDCPEASRNIYIYGIRIYRDRVENLEDPEKKAAALDTLMLIYDKRMQYFKQEGLVTGRKGLDLLKYDPGQAEAAYGLLKRSLEINQVNTEESVLVTIMQLSNLFFQQEAIPGRELIDNYLVITDILEKKIASGRSRIVQRAKKALPSVESIFAQSGAADCGTLIEIFTPKFDEAPEDIELLKKILGLLTDQGCEDSELFASASENLYRLEPSAEAAYNLAKLFLKKEDLDKAVSYYEEAIANSTVPVDLAHYHYELGLIQFTKYNDFKRARYEAKAAIENKPDWGEPYILIGNLYASSSDQCGENDFEQSTVFWAAVDKFQEAKRVDSSVTEEADEAIRKYSRYFPNVEDAFFYGFEDGKSYTVGCWINETTTVRTRKRP